MTIKRRKKGLKKRTVSIDDLSLRGKDVSSTRIIEIIKNIKDTGLRDQVSDLRKTIDGLRGLAGKTNDSKLEPRIQKLEGALTRLLDNQPEDTSVEDNEKILNDLWSKAKEKINTETQDIKQELQLKYYVIDLRKVGIK